MDTRHDELELLSDAALALSELGPDEDVFRFIAERLAPLAPDSIVMTVSYDASAERATVRAVAGPEDMLRLAREVAGEPIGQVFVLDDEGRQILSEGKLRNVPGGMHQLTFRRWPPAIWQRFERELGIRSVHGQPFSRRGDFLGAVAFASRQTSLEHAAAIEVLVRLAGVAIQRRRSEARLRDSEQRFRMLAENSRDVIFRLRVVPKLAFEYVSPAVERLLGVTPEQLYEHPRLGVPCLVPEAWLAAGAPGELPREPVIASCPRQDGTQIWTEQNFSAVRDASGTIAIEGIARDITKRKEAEAAIVETDRRKTELLGMLSHELRNPLSAIRSGVYLLGHAGLGEERARRALGAIDRQCEQLTRLIDDLLDVTRIMRGKVRLQREPVELNELVRATVDDYSSTFQSAKIDVQVQPAPGDAIVLADRARIRQIVENLVHNGTKFTPPGGRVSVSVRVDSARSEAVVRVHNTGPPIPKDVLARVFEPFVQADRTLDRSKGGLGLGLALVKGLVEMHAGTVEVESEEGTGTAFTVRIPLHEPVSAAHRSEPRDTRSGARRRVLVIEDNADAADLLRMVLELRGNAVTVASNGPEGIGAARTFGPDVVLCDIGLPGMSGYEVARAMRDDPGLRTLPLVALSGYATPEDVMRAREAGFDRHVAKPPAIADLESVIADLTGAR